jgi:hypothetical protein
MTTSAYPTSPFMPFTDALSGNTVSEYTAVRLPA